jgi:hypothetical protein
MREPQVSGSLVEESIRRALDSFPTIMFSALSILVEELYFSMYDRKDMDKPTQLSQKVSKPLDVYYHLYGVNMMTDLS